VNRYTGNSIYKKKTLPHIKHYVFYFGLWQKKRWLQKYKNVNSFFDVFCLFRAAKKIQSLLFSGCAALSCAVSYVGHQKEKQVKMKMRQLLQSAVTEEDFNKIATGQQRLMQLQVQTECGEVNVSKQEFQTRVKNETLLLTETFQLESQHFKTSARFASCLRFVSDKTFGS
jgi:hypothetical protein